jgi:hypothetical protein
MADEPEVKKLRTWTPEEIAESIVSVQPINGIDWEALDQHPLMQSFMKRLASHKKEEDATIP